MVVEADGEHWPEDEWLGRTARIGAVELGDLQPCIRCTMVTRAQPGLDRDLDTYRTLARHHGGTFGVWASVRTPGTIRVGDPVEIVG
jgi:MOSC domain-containing protein